MSRFLYLCLYTLINIINSSNILKLPFHLIFPTEGDITPENFPYIFYESNYYIVMTVGLNLQKIPMRLSFANYHSFLTNTSYLGNYTKFNSSKSSIYHNKTFDPRTFSLININQGIYPTETFRLKQYNDNDKEISWENIDFILATKPAFGISGDFV